MRIIGGEFKRKKLNEPINKKTRPLKDLTKESLFNILNHSNKFNFNLKDSSILDLFSGVGSFGIEALSRGSKFVTFVENLDEVLNVLKKNINSLNINEKYEIIEEDVFLFLNKINIENKYNLIFLDPPYKEKEINSLLNTINYKEILDNKGLLVIHRHKSEIDTFPKNFNILEQKIYGISKIIIGEYN